MINFRQREKEYKRQIKELEHKITNLQKREPYYNKIVVPLIDLTKITFNPSELINRVEYND